MTDKGPRTAARLLCLFGVHRWVEWKCCSASTLDCRACSRCDRFEIYAYGSFRRVPPERWRALKAWRDKLAALDSTDRP